MHLFNSKEMIILVMGQVTMDTTVVHTQINAETDTIQKLMIRKTIFYK